MMMDELISGTVVGTGGLPGLGKMPPLERDFTAEGVKSTVQGKKTR